MDEPRSESTGLTSSAAESGLLSDFYDRMQSEDRFFPEEKETKEIIEAREMKMIGQEQSASFRACYVR